MGAGVRVGCRLADKSSCAPERSCASGAIAPDDGNTGWGPAHGSIRPDRSMAMFTPAVILVDESPANAPAPDEAALQALWRRLISEPAPFIPLGPNAAVVGALLAECAEGRLTGKGDSV